MAAVSLFWDTNMADVTSCENTLFNGVQAPSPPPPCGYKPETLFFRELISFP